MILCPQAKIICDTLIKNNMDIDITYDILCNIFNDEMFTKEYLLRIKNKKIWCAISHFYF